MKCKNPKCGHYITKQDGIWLHNIYCQHGSIIDYWKECEECGCTKPETKNKEEKNFFTEWDKVIKKM